MDISRANRLICAESTLDYFVTVFYAGLDLKSGQMTYVNAGHPPPFWCRSGGKVGVLPLQNTGMALGIESNAAYAQCTIQLDPGDFILGYTDGVTEACNKNQELFGGKQVGIYDCRMH